LKFLNADDIHQSRNFKSTMPGIGATAAEFG
jgi:hypothetical protein